MAMSNKAAGAATASGVGLAWRVGVLCALIQILDGYDLVSIGLAVPSLIKEWSLRPAAFTPAFVASSVGIMVGALLSGPIADKFGRKPTLLISIGLFGAASLLSAYADALPMLSVLRFFTGIGIGGAMPTTVALTSDFVSERRRTQAVMFMFTGASLGGFLAGQIAKQILPVMGWQGIFLVGGIVPLILLAVVLFALPESPQFQAGARPPEAKENPVSGLFKDGLAASTLLIWAIFLLNLLNLYLVNYWLPTVLNLGGFKPEDAAFVSSMFQAGGVLCTLVLAPAMSRWGEAPVLAICLAVGAVCLGLTALHLSYVGVILALIGAGAGIIGSQLGLNGFVASLYPASVRTTGIGWALGVGRLGGIIGPVLGGALLGFGLPHDKVMLFACGPGLLTAILVVVLGTERRR